MTERRARLIRKTAGCGRSGRSVMLAGLFTLGVVHPPVHAAQAPTEDSLWYYEIGGAEPVSAPVFRIGLLITRSARRKLAR